MLRELIRREEAIVTVLLTMVNVVLRR